MSLPPGMRSSNSTPPRRLQTGSLSGSRIKFQLLNALAANNHRRNRPIFQAPGQGPLRHVLARRHFLLFNLFHPLELLVVKLKTVERASVILRESGPGFVAPAQKPFCQWHSRQDPEAMPFAKRQHLLLGFSMKAVVN